MGLRKVRLGARGDSMYIKNWKRESVATGGSDYHHPRTRVHLLVGAEDFVMTDAGEGWMLPHAELYLDRLRRAGSPWVTLEQIPGTKHGILATQAGRDMLRAALLAER